MAGGSAFAVYAAIAGNSVITIAKLGGFLFTGSSAMLAEAIHSLADVGNQSLLALGLRRAKLPPDEEHPGGYGRDAFVWAMISAVGIFFLGCGVTIAHGVQSLLHPHGEVTGVEVAVGILLFSLVVDGTTLTLAVKALRDEAAHHGRGFWEHVRTTDDPFGVAVLLEDSAASVGVLIALAALVIGSVTHTAWLDAAASVAIGSLLGLIAIWLIRLNRDLLIGRAVSDAERARIDHVLATEPLVEHIAKKAAVVTGPDSYRVRAELELDGHQLAGLVLEDLDLDEIHHGLRTPGDLRDFLGAYTDAAMHVVGDEIDRIEARIRAEVPKASDIDLEID